MRRIGEDEINRARIRCPQREPDPASVRFRASTQPAALGEVVGFRLRSRLRVRGGQGEGLLARGGGLVVHLRGNPPEVLAERTVEHYAPMEHCADSAFVEVDVGFECRATVIVERGLHRRLRPLGRGPALRVPTAGKAQVSEWTIQQPRAVSEMHSHRWHGDPPYSVRSVATVCANFSAARDINPMTATQAGETRIFLQETRPLVLGCPSSVDDGSIVCLCRIAGECACTGIQTEFGDKPVLRCQVRCVER